MYDKKSVSSIFLSNTQESCTALYLLEIGKKELVSYNLPRGKLNRIHRHTPCAPPHGHSAKKARHLNKREMTRDTCRGPPNFLASALIRAAPYDRFHAELS